MANDFHISIKLLNLFSWYHTGFVKVREIIFVLVAIFMKLSLR